MRLLLAVLAGAAVAALGGVILGEYPFTGLMPYASGVLFAVVVAEVVIAIARRRRPLTGAAAAVCTAGGLGWALWISSGRGVAPVPLGGWMALAIGVVVALAVGGITGTRGTAPDNREGQERHRRGNRRPPVG